MGKQTACLIAMILALTACGGRGGRQGQAPAATEPQPVETPDTASVPADTSVLFEDVSAVLEEMTEHPVVAETPARLVRKTVTLAEGVEIDKTVHDFGDILLTDGPQKCTFTLHNTGSAPLTILEVVTSCGCTEAEWTREEIAPGKQGTISVTYKNGDGPLPFDKTLTVYLSTVRKPQLLHIRGCVHEKKKSLGELYGACRRGDLGLKEDDIKVGNMEQGESRSGEALVANLGRKPLRVDFRDTDPQLSLSVEPNPIPAGKTAVLTYTVRSDRDIWGKRTYHATPVLNGQPQDAPIAFWAITKENFSDWTQEQRDHAAQPVFDESTAAFNTVPSGTEVTVSYTVTNRGKSPFSCYAVYADSPVSIDPVEEIAPGGKQTFSVRIPTEKLPKGETTVMLTLITNSPIRPIINLFAVGIIE
ncbi:MAG: DUF1573 domain-containing protein [Bacteroidales bacterium]|nr:DUF1573 domain-containing protein [Bacteroidales bacterium]